MPFASEIIMVKLMFTYCLPSDVSSYARPDIGYPYDVTVTRRESEGFGFVIISSVNKAGSTIGKHIIVFLFQLCKSVAKQSFKIA
jgi:hypothetical protein